MDRETEREGKRGRERRECGVPLQRLVGTWAGAAVPVNSPDTHQGNLSLPGSEVEEEILFGRCLGMARTPCWRPNKTTFPIMAATPCPAPRGEINQTYGHYYLQHRNYIKVITRSAARKTMELQVDSERDHRRDETCCGVPLGSTSRWTGK